MKINGQVAQMFHGSREIGSKNGDLQCARHIFQNVGAGRAKNYPAYPFHFFNAE